MTTREEVDAFKKHRLWTLISSVNDEVTKSSGRSGTDRETLARVVAVGAYIKSYRAIGPYLFAANRESSLESLAGIFDAMSSQLAGWDREAAMAQSTVSNLDALCDQVLQSIVAYQWPIAQKASSADALAKAADSYRLVADASLAAIARDVNSATQKLKALQKAAYLLAEESTARAKEAKDALETIATIQQGQSENAQQSLQTDLMAVNEAAKAQRREFSAEAEEILIILRADRDAGNLLVKQVADQSVGGEYLAFAEREMKAYKNWNRAGFISGGVAFAYLAFVFTLGAPSIEGSILKLGVSLSVIALSAYAFREAGKHQRQSVEARYRALDVLAIDPFSKDLEENQKASLRYLMGERLFGRSVSDATSGRKNDDKTNSFNFSLDTATIKTIAETAKALRDTSTSG